MLLLDCAKAWFDPSHCLFRVWSADFQSAFMVIAISKPTASRRSGLWAFRAKHEISGLSVVAKPVSRNFGSRPVGSRFALAPVWLLNAAGFPLSLQPGPTAIGLALMAGEPARYERR